MKMNISKYQLCRVAGSAAATVLVAVVAYVLFVNVNTVVTFFGGIINSVGQTVGQVVFNNSFIIISVVIAVINFVFTVFLWSVYRNNRCVDNVESTCAFIWVIGTILGLLAVCIYCFDLSAMDPFSVIFSFIPGWLLAIYAVFYESALFKICNRFKNDK